MFLYMKSVSNGFVWLIWSCPKTCKAKQKKKQQNVSRPDFYKKESERALFILLFATFFNISN